MSEKTPGSDVAARLAADVYRDIAHPTAKRVGDALDSLSKVALSPVALIDWSYEQCKEWLRDKVRMRLGSIPPESVVMPSLTIAVPAITNAAMAHDAPELRELYAELLLKAMDARTKDTVHPAYIHVVQQLSSDEARLLLALRQIGEDIFVEEVSPYVPMPGDKPTIEEQFVERCREIGLEDPARGKVWLDNLLRLRLLSLSHFTEAEYVPPEYHRDGTQDARVTNHGTRYLRFTDFGIALVEACRPAADGA